MRRLRLIRPPQLGHKCFELTLSPSIVEIVTSAPTHAVMAITGLRFLAGTASRGRWVLRTYLSNSFDDRSAVRGTLAVRASETGLSAYVEAPTRRRRQSQLSEPFNHWHSRAQTDHGSHRRRLQHRSRKAQAAADPTTVRKRACYVHRSSVPEIA